MTKKKPAKRNAVNMNLMTTNSRKKNRSPNGTKTTMRIQGYAFEDDIIGLTHVRSDEEDAFNLTLRSMVLNNELKEHGIFGYVTLRDPSSGKHDDHLRGADGYPKYMFLSMGKHQFKNAKEAIPLVKEQCNILYDVSFVHEATICM